ncbi:unnamed protein product, partial [Ectocarpus fasciculatus]
GGLLFFLIAHVFYIAYFFEKPIRLMAYLPFAVFVVVLLCILLPEIPGDLKLPVTVYALVIGTMVGAAWSKCINGNKWDTNKLMGAIGALIFVVSDTIIAVNKFYFPFDSAKTWVMITYYLGQTLIAASTHLNVSSKRKLK